MKYRLCWFPQIPCEPFIVEIKDIDQAKFLIPILAEYDIFQFENNIKPDYCNAADFQYFDDEEQDWLTWYDDNGNSIDDIMNSEEK